MTGDDYMFQCSFLEKWMDISEYYKSPLTFRYVQNIRLLFMESFYPVVWITTYYGKLLKVMELQFHPDG